MSRLPEYVPADDGSQLPYLPPARPDEPSFHRVPMNLTAEEIRTLVSDIVG